MRRILFLIAIAGALPAPGLAYQLTRGVIGNGAAPVAGAAGTGRTVRATAGQASVGSSSGPASALHHGYWFGGPVGGLVAVEPGPTPGAGAALALHFAPPMPNPARGPVTFAFTVPRAAEVRVTVLDVQGRRVGSIEAGQLGPGSHRLRWDGAASEHAGAGVYFARLEVDGQTVGTRRLVVRP